MTHPPFEFVVVAVKVVAVVVIDDREASPVIQFMQHTQLKKRFSRSFHICLKTLESFSNSSHSKLEDSNQNNSKHKLQNGERIERAHHPEGQLLL